MAGATGVVEDSTGAIGVDISIVAGAGGAPSDLLNNLKSSSQIKGAASGAIDGET